MIDYKRFFDIGLEAAATAEHNQEEIDSVFDELNRQLASMSGNKVAIRRTKSSLASKLPMSHKLGWKLAVESTVRDTPVTEIAKWEMDDLGYPCTVETAGTRWACLDQEGLENALGLLLQEPFVGEILRRYLRITLNDE